VGAAIAIRLGSKDPFAHLNRSLFDAKFVMGSNSLYDRWLNKFDTRFQQANDPFILHHKAKYGPNSPVPFG